MPDVIADAHGHTNEMQLLLGLISALVVARRNIGRMVRVVKASLNAYTAGHVKPGRHAALNGLAVLHPHLVTFGRRHVTVVRRRQEHDHVLVVHRRLLHGIGQKRGVKSTRRIAERRRASTIHGH